MIAGNPDLYARLGLTKDADRAAIRAAFRALAVKHHPDAGGTLEDFQALEEAHRVLNDPEMRAHYDATGQASRPQPVHPDADIFDAAGRLLLMVINDVDDPLGTDLLDVAKSRLADERAAVQEQIAQVRKVLGRLDAVIDRIKPAADGGENALATILRGRKDVLEREAAQRTASLRTYDRLADFLDRHSYDFIRKLVGSLSTGPIWSSTHFPDRFFTPDGNDAFASRSRRRP